MEYFNKRNLQKLSNQYKEPYDMVKNYQSSRYNKEEIYKLLDNFFNKKMIKDYNLKQLKMFKVQNNFPIIKSNLNNDFKLFNQSSPLNLLNQESSQEKETNFINQMKNDKLTNNRLTNENNVFNMRDFMALGDSINRQLNALENRNDLTNAEINNIKSINIKKLLSESLDEKGLNKNKLMENISESVIPSMRSTMVNVLNEGIANYNFKKYPGKTSDQKTQNIYKLQEEVNRLRKRNEELEKNNYTDVNVIDEDQAPEEKINNNNNNNQTSEEIEGSGIFDSLGALISKFAPSIIKGVKVIAPSVLSAGKKIISNPKNQQDAFNFVKDKLKKKEVVKLTEDQELFDMFKQGKITAQDYKELRGFNTKDIKPIKEIKEIKNDDEHLKNLSGQYAPKKIYLDLLTNKHITPEKYLELISHGKIPKLSKPIIAPEIIDEPVKPVEPIEPLEQQGKGFKRKYVKRKNIN
jgi:hypothetical protein